MRALAITDVGIRRENNEDYFMMNQERRIFVISDGMGGYQAGEIASEIASKAILEEFEAIQSFHFEEDIYKLLDRANDAILDYVKEHPECRGMGTTVVVAYLGEDKLHLANVGDSRGYGVNKSSIKQLTQDHSLVAELVKIGSISAEEAESHPDRNIITSALGVEHKYEVFIQSFDVHEFDYVLLCSDGLSNMVTSQEILNVFQNVSFESIPEKLVEMANAQGGKDNITVLCIEL